MPAIPQGNADEKLCWGLGAGTIVAGVPQRWQNFAPGVSAAPHAAQVAPASGAPQLEQYFPLVVFPHDAHVVVGLSGGEAEEAMQRKLHGLCLHVSVCVVHPAPRFPRPSRRRDSYRASS